MPIIKSAIKKLRKDRKREKFNDAKRAALRKAIKKAQKSKNPQDLKKAISLIDKAAKVHLLHKNKASRLKSRLAKLVGNKPAKKTPATKRKTPSNPKRKSAKNRNSI